MIKDNCNPCSKCGGTQRRVCPSIPKGQCVNCKKEYQKTYQDSLKGITRRILYFYNLSLSQFETLLLDQDGCCKLCGEIFLPGEMPIIDHNHNCCSGKRSCGKCVRGLLHRACNVGLGVVENTAFVQKANNYLKGTQTI